MYVFLLNLLNRSITAGWLILTVILIRLLFRRAPKWLFCLLWGIVAIRLISPISIKSSFSLIPSSKTVTVDLTNQEPPVIDSGFKIIDDAVNPMVSQAGMNEPEAGGFTIQDIMTIGFYIWAAGVFILLGYALTSYLKIKNTVAESILSKDNVYVCDDINTAFILGICKPKIYVPSSASEDTLKHVTTHEKAHLKRFDHWWKLLGFLLLAVFWFNPLCWIAYALFLRDMEMACDEKVIRSMEKDDVAAYSQILLNFSSSKKRLAAYPLAFGEVSTKARIKNILNYKKPAFWILLLSIAAVLVLSLCLLTDPFSDGKNIDGSAIDPGNSAQEEPASMTSLRRIYGQYFDLPTENGLDVYVSENPGNYFTCILLPGAEDKKSEMELIKMRAAKIQEMKEILSTYNIDPENVHIIMWQNPFSSHVGEYWIHWEGEDEETIETNRRIYIEKVRRQLF